MGRPPAPRLPWPLGDTAFDLLVTYPYSLPIICVSATPRSFHSVPAIYILAIVCGHLRCQGYHGFIHGVTSAAKAAMASVMLPIAFGIDALIVPGPFFTTFTAYQ
eukprot:scaffold175115_cov21-Tisochrysis_lutea.AAC.1